MSIFSSAITGADGQVDAGYLAMFAVMLIVMGAVPSMCIGTFLAMWYAPDHRFDVQSLGVGIGAVCGGFATAIGAVGLFRAGDKEKKT